ncbi:MAG TPA: sigma-54 dependent transcriptional regulator [Phycisphaerae bacterium]|nr:sigma-54 dependent transcriptional regulator [Phycisphaerae bacterium]
MANLLLVDDDPKLIAAQISHVLAPHGVHTSIAVNGEEAIKHVARSVPDIVLLDVRLPDLGGLEVYERIRQIDARIPVIFVTATASAETAIEAMRHGAFDYLFKPLDLQRLKDVVTQALEVSRLMRAPAVVADTSDSAAEQIQGDAIVGCCPGMAEVYKAIGRVADQNVIVLITGESGTGKELVARAVYQHSRRSDKPFLAINCAAIPESLLESELFGHEKGAFTGADRRRIGKFEQCNGGTIFLDEIGDMPLATQGKILRLLQDQKFERVGGNETIQTDVRVIAATNRDLKALSEQGKFRPDLYYRLSVFTIRLPSLRERGEDLPMLVHYYLQRFNRELNRDVREVSPDAMERLRVYSWPGNVRELQSVVKQALLHTIGTVLISSFLPDLASSPNSQSPTYPLTSAEKGIDFENFIQSRLEAGSSNLHAEALIELDRIILPAVLRFTNGSQHHAAKILGLARQTLRLRLRELGISVAKTVEEDDTEVK